MKKVWKRLPVLLAFIVSLTSTAFAQIGSGQSEVIPTEFQWPQVIETPEAKIVIYQPQLEDFQANRVSSRFAASLQKTGQEEPVFGAVWVEARFETQRDNRTVQLVAIEKVRSRFPEATPQEEQWFANVLKREIPQWNVVLSIDQLVAGLEIQQERFENEQALNNEPPQIIYVDKPAALVMVDGDPILQPIENTELMAVINTPFPMVFRKTDKTYYLIGKEAWYKSREITGQWQETSDPPADVAALEREPSEDEEAESAVTTGIQVFGATEPTELLSIEGDPQLIPFTGNNLMYVDNTDNDLLYEVDTGNYYLLLSGRWYRGPKLMGPWSYVAPDQLPENFNDISADSQKADLRANVPGTEEAMDAVLDAQIPETAVVKRSEATLTVEYDGDPEFELIEGTEIDYAINTATPVIRLHGRFYAVNNGIWFVAARANGPWIVADYVPAEVQDIPPSSPVNNIKYVYIYDSTPEVVYVGYTPGYTGCYIHRGVVVYGTGYYYRPWYRHHYYPRHFTYGFGIRYSSYYGWSFGYSFYHGPFSFHFGYAWGPYRYGGWWGPPRYRPPYYRPPHYRPRPPRPPGNRPPGKRPPIAKPPSGGRPGRPVHLPAGQRPNRPSSGNLYNKRPATRPGVTRPGIANRPGAARPATLPNNVYTDRQGNIYRRGQNGWEQRQNGTWQQRPSITRPTTPSQQPSITRPTRPTQQPTRPSTGTITRPSTGTVTRPSTGTITRPSTQTRPSTSRQQTPRINNRQSLENQQQNRDRGNQRTRQFYQNQQQQRNSANRNTQRQNTQRQNTQRQQGARGGRTR